MDSTMKRFVVIFHILYVFAVTVRSAPTADHACANVAKSAFEFNRKARLEARSGPRGFKDFTTSLAWMEARDMCDPGTLRHTPGPCIEKMLDVLTRYKSFVKVVSEFESCSSALRVERVLNDLHDDMTTCVRSRTGYEQKAHHMSVNELNLKDTWQEELLCHYLMERLFSFSILTARVYFPGDPAKHAEPSAPDCALRN